MSAWPNVFARIPNHFDRFEVHVTTFHDARETVIVEGRYRASSATVADALDARVCHVWKVRDGRLAGFQQYTDTLQSAQRIDLMTEPTPSSSRPPHGRT